MLLSYLALHLKTSFYLLESGWTFIKLFVSSLDSQESLQNTLPIYHHISPWKCRVLDLTYIHCSLFESINFYIMVHWTQNNNYRVNAMAFPLMDMTWWHYTVMNKENAAIRNRSFWCQLRHIYGSLLNQLPPDMWKKWFNWSFMECCSLPNKFWLRTSIKIVMDVFYDTNINMSYVFTVGFIKPQTRCFCLQHLVCCKLLKVWVLATLDYVACGGLWAWPAPYASSHGCRQTALPTHTKL